MKKLIALLAIVGIATVTAYAETELRESLSKAVVQANTNAELQARQVSLKAYDGNIPSYGDEGEAVIVGFDQNYTKVILMATRDLANGIESLGSNYLRGKITKGAIVPDGDGRLKYRTVHGTLLIKIELAVKLKGKNLEKAKNLRMLKDENAIALAQKIQGKIDAQDAARRKHIIFTK